MSFDLAQPYIRALRQRRRGITATCSLIVLCGVVQLLTFGLVHYTDLRHVHVEAQATEEAPLIVTDQDRSPDAAGQVAAATTEAEATGVNAVSTKYDVIFAAAIGISRAVALLAAFLLTGQLLVAVIVAAQAQLMALPRVASAACTAMLLGLSLAPWGEVFPALGFPGALPSYQYMLDTAPQASADAGLAASAAILGANIVLPAFVIVLASLILLRFHIAISDDCKTALQHESELRNETNTPELAMEAVRKARTQIQNSGDNESLHPAMRPQRDELPSDVQSILSKSARRTRPSQREEGGESSPPPTPTPAPPPPAGEERRSTQVGSTEPLRRPI
ncbi:MAG: hypothetical protein ACF8NJ_05395 [Phycisphaerales bacterium JB038]